MEPFQEPRVSLVTANWLPELLQQRGEVEKDAKKIRKLVVAMCAERPDLCGATTKALGKKQAAKMKAGGGELEDELDKLGRS